MKILRGKERQDFIDRIDDAMIDVRQEFDRLAFDERDNDPSLQKTLEQSLERKLTEAEFRCREFKDNSRLVDKACDAAAHLAYIYRVGDAVMQAEANLKYQKALSSVG
jgi:hypothetical protein